MSTAELPDLESVLRPDDAREMLDRQTEVLELIAAATPLHEVLDEILTSLERLIPGARCSVLLLDRERRTLHHGAAPSLPARYVAAIDGLAIGDSAGSCGTAAALNTAVVATDVRTDPRWVDFRGAADAAGLRSCWSTPIEGRDGRPVGTFAVYHDEPHRPSGREQLLVDRFTHLASVAIEHAGLVGDLVASEERFRRSFDDNSLGMALVGLDRRIARSNTALASLTGDGPTLVGSPLADLVTPKEGSLEARLDELHHAAAPVVFEALLHRSGHRDVEVEVTVSLLHGRDGTPAQYVVNVFDLTERRAAERHRRARLEAETARRTAEEHSRAKSELLAAVGHEARTPIQAIVGFAELLGTIDLDAARRQEALDHISAAAGHVMDLLADVLDLSRIEAGALPLLLEPVAVREVVAEVFGLLSSKAEARQVELSHDVADEVVLADRRRLRQVLLNLVGNSIRHGRPAGHVTVRSGLTGDHGWVVTCVDDDGPGIPDDLLPRAFTGFARPDRAAGQAIPSEAGDLSPEESIGLGLGLAHGLADAMGGELCVGRSGPEGTSMVLRLPSADGALP
jgi:PAS domain S-box-containing protein